MEAQYSNVGNAVTFRGNRNTRSASMNAIKKGLDDEIVEDS